MVPGAAPARERHHEARLAVAQHLPIADRPCRVAVPDPRRKKGLHVDVSGSRPAIGTGVGGGTDAHAGGSSVAGSRSWRSGLGQATGRTSKPGPPSHAVSSLRLAGQPPASSLIGPTTVTNLLS